MKKTGYGYKIICWIMICCFFCFTIGQFIPLYFTDHKFKEYYYLILLLATTLSSGIVCARMVYNPQLNNWIYSGLYALVISSFCFIVCFIIMFEQMMAIWTDGVTLYTNKSNPQLKIVSRYINLEAFGGGTSPKDFEIVLSRSLSPLLKIQTKIDTNSIDKGEWSRVNPVNN